MKRRLRIASVIGDLAFGGSQNRLLSFARTIDRTRFDHVLITLYRGQASHEQQVGSLRPIFAEAGIEVIDLGMEPRVRIRPSRRPAHVIGAGVTLGRLVRRLCRVIRERRIDLIDAQHATATLFGVVAGSLTGRPTTVTQYFPTYFDRPGMRLLGQAVYARADAFICDSRANSDLINRWMYRPHRRAMVIPNGVPVPVATRTNPEMRRLLDIPLDPSVRVVGQVSRLIPYKGQRVLLRAAREVLSQRPDTYFILTGSANEDPVTNVGGVEEMVTHEETGLVVPTNDPGALAAGVLRLLRDPATCRRLGAAAQCRYQERYRPEVMSRALEDLFVELIGPDRARAS